MNIAETNKELFTQKINNLIIISLLVVIAAITIIIILTFNRGFDFADEGYYLLSYKHTDIYRGGIFNYHIIIAGLTDWSNPGIMAYRWMSFLLILLSSFVLSFGLYKWVKANYTINNLYLKYIFIFSIISIGNYLFFFVGLHTISYNTLINFFLQVSTGFILYLFSFDPDKLFKSKFNIFILILLGFICSYSFFTKFSTGILQIFIYTLLIIWFLRKQTFKNIFLPVVIFVSGSLIGFLTYFIFFQNYSEWVANFYVELTILPDHSPIHLIRQYVHDIFSIIGFILHYFSWLIIFPALTFVNSIPHSYLNKKNKKYLITIIVSLSLVLFIYQIIQFKFYRSAFAGNQLTNGYFYILIMIIQIFLVFSILLNKKMVNWPFFKSNLNKIVIILFLSCSTFIGVIGTYNTLFLNVLIHIAPWFGVMLILLIELSKHIRNMKAHLIFIIFIVAVTASQIIDGNLYIPYSGEGFQSPRYTFFHQTESVPELPLLDGVKVDKKTKTFMLELKALFDKHNFKKGYPVFGFFIPGIIYLLDGISPGVPFYFNEDRDCRAIEHFKINSNLPVIIISENRPISDKVLNSLRNVNILYPEEYFLIGEVKNHHGILLKVYFPKTLL